jgi:hypothetical protein
MTDLKVVIALAGILLGGTLPVSAVVASECLESTAGDQSGSQGSEVVGMVVSVTEDEAGQLSVVVQGAPSQGVRVEAASDVKVIAVGGDGSAGTPGASGRK